MPEQKLLNEFYDLNHKVLAKKEELEAKILPLVQEFTQETGLLVRSIEPGYVETTCMEDQLRQYVVGSARVHTDVDIRGISGRIIG